MWENYKSTKSESDTRKERNILYIISWVFKKRMSINDIVNSFTVSLSILLRDSFSDKIIGFVSCPAQPRAAHWQWDLFVVTRQFYPANHKSSLVTANRYPSPTSLQAEPSHKLTLKYFPAKSWTPMMAKMSQKMIQTINTLKILGIAWTRALTTTWGRKCEKFLYKSYLIFNVSANMQS